MPPSVKLKKEDIIEKAFELTRKNGFENITARSLAKELDCSTQPIFSSYENMDTLKRDVYKKAQTFFEEFMNVDSKNEYPHFLNMGIKYLELAKHERHLFKLICMSDNFKLKSLYDLAGDNIPIQNKKQFVKMWIFTHGVASIIATNNTDIDDDEIKNLLIEVFMDFGQSELNRI